MRCRGGLSCWVLLTGVAVAMMPALAHAQAPSASATDQTAIVVLHNGGRLAGAVEESEIDKRAIVHVRTENGLQVTLAKEQVKQIHRPSEQLAEYRRLKAEMGDSVDEHWRISEWCRENLESRFRSGTGTLSPQRKYHLEQIVQIDPEHKMARALLGFTKEDGVWINLEQVRMGHGMIRDGRRWITEGELAARNAEEEWKDSQKAWLRQLKKWRGTSGADLQKALAEMKQVNDPAAVSPVIDLLKEEQSVDWALHYVEMLGNIHSNAAVNTLADVAVLFAHQSVRERSLVQLKRDHVDRKSVAMRLHNYLHNPNNEIINRAGFVLGELGHSISVIPLINSLVTTHAQANPLAGNPGAIGASFGDSGINGLQMGSPQPRILKFRMENRAVLDALSRITGANHGFNIDLWKDWYTSNYELNDVDVRRDE